MQTNKDITSFNGKGEPHGYWEYYYSDDKLWYKGNFVNGKPSGLWIVNDKEYFYAN